MSKFGLTGRIGSGKTTVMEMLAEKGAKTFYSDCRIHQFYKDHQHPIYKKVRETFPESKLGKEISRKKLAEVVFTDKHKLKKLEQIVHPAIIKALREWLKSSKEKNICVAEIPLLFEKKLEKIFDKNILVKVENDILIARLKENYNFCDQEIKQRLSLHLPVVESEKKSDFVLENNSDLKNLEKEVNLLWQKINQI